MHLSRNSLEFYETEDFYQVFYNSLPLITAPTQVNLIQILTIYVFEIRSLQLRTETAPCNRACTH